MEKENRNILPSNYHVKHKHKLTTFIVVASQESVMSQILEEIPSPQFLTTGFYAATVQ